MKLTPEKLAEWKALVTKLIDDSSDHMGVAHSTDMPPQHTVNFRHAKNAHEAAWAITNLIADLEEANARADAAGNMSEYNFKCRESLREELADVRKQLAEAQSSEAHWRANYDNVVRKLRFFTQRDDLPVDRLQAYEYVLELEKQLAETQALNAQLLSVAEKMRCAGGAQEFQHWFDELKLFLLCKPDTSALDAVITEAIADEKQNPWKRAIIHCLIINHILNAAHETDPVNALTALVDWECKVVLDPAVSKEAQELIEPYRKDAARWKELLSRLGDDSGPTIVKIEGWSDEYPGYAWFADLTQEQVIAELDAAIATKGDGK